MIEQGPSLLTVVVQTVEHAEYLEAFKAGKRLGPRVPAVPYTVFLFLLFFFGYWLWKRDAITLGIVSAIFLLCAFAFKWMQSRRLREAMESAGKSLPAKLTFKEYGVFGETRDLESFRAWPHFGGYFETKQVIVLVSNHSRSYLTIPKRECEPSTLATVQGLLSARLKRL